MSERLNYIKDNGLAEAIDENIDMSDIGRLRIAGDIKFLIEQAGKFQEIKSAWTDIEDNENLQDARVFYDIVHDILGGRSW